MKSQLFRFIFAASCIGLVLGACDARGNGFWENCRFWTRALSKPFRGTEQRKFDELLATIQARPFRAHGVGKITAAYDNASSKPVRINLEGVSNDAHYAFEPGKEGDPDLSAAKLNPRQLPGSHWPYVAKDYRFYKDDLADLQKTLRIRDQIVELGQNGTGPEVVAWDVHADPVHPDKRYVLRIVTKNLAHGPDVLAAGSLVDVGHRLRRLPEQAQKAALVDVMKILCHHNDPGIQNSYLVFRKDPNAPTGETVSAFHIDVGVDRGPLQAILQGVAHERQATPALRFKTLQKGVLRYFPQLPQNSQGLAVTAEEVLGNSELAKQIDRELAQSATR